MKNKSFTLIELLVVIVIIGVLAGVIIVTTTSSISKANVTKGKVFSESIKNKLILDLISEWSFDDESDLGLDAWGTTNGTVNGTIIPKNDNECVSGKCIELGENDYIESTTINNLDGNNFFTLEAWINPSNVTGNMGIVNYNPNFILVIYNSRIVYQDKKRSSIRANSQSILTTNKWQHIVVTTDGETTQDQKIYIDGKLVVNDYTYGYGGPSVQHLFIGGKGYDEGNFYTGKIDEVKVYNTFLSFSQVKQSYIAGLNSLLSKGLISKDEYNSRIESLSQN